MPLLYKAQKMVKKKWTNSIIFLSYLFKGKISKNPRPKNRPLLGGCFQNFTLDSAKKSFTVVIKSRNTMERADGKSVIWNTYICTISKRPSCDCPYFLGQEDQTCKHIIWTLSNLFNVDQESSILYQVTFTEDEMKLLNKQVCCDILRNLVFQGETYSNEQQQEGKLTQEKHQTDAERVTRALRKNPSCGKKKTDWLVRRFKK